MKPKKLTAQQEAFCQARANGMGPSAAYRASRDCSRMATSTVNANAKKLGRVAAVKARIAELERESRESRGTAGEAPATKRLSTANGLKAEHERFCQHYVLNFNGAAAIAACAASNRKLSPQKQAEKAVRWLADEKIANRIAELRAKVIAAADKKFDITVDRCLKEYARMGLSNMEDYVERLPDGTARLDLTRIGRDEMAAVQEMTFETVITNAAEDLAAAGAEAEDGSKPPKVKVLKCKFKLHDKKGSLDSMMKHLGGFKADNEQGAKAAGAALGEALSEMEVARRVAFMFSEALAQQQAAKASSGSAASPAGGHVA